MKGDNDNEKNDSEIWRGIGIICFHSNITNVNTTCVFIVYQPKLPQNATLEIPLRPISVRIAGFKMTFRESTEK